MKSLLTGLAAAMVPFLTAPPALAQTDKELVPDALESKSGKDGVHTRLTLGASLAFGQSNDVVGAQDGQTWNIGPQVDFGLDWYSGGSEWRNTVSLHEVFTRTPLIEEFVKSVDTLKIESIYLLHLANLDWFGPFVRARLDTSLFPTTAVYADEKERWIVTNELEEDGTSPRVQKTASDRLDLTNGFAPLKLSESAGVFAAPITTDEFALLFRVGAGAREVFVQNGFALNDDEKTDKDVEIVRLKDYSQIGAELYVGAKGKLVWESLGKDRPFVYSADVEWLYPFLSTLDSDKEGIDLSSLDIGLKLGVKLFAWMSLDYGLRVVREPLLIDKFQIQNNLLLNFSYALVE